MFLACNMTLHFWWPAAEPTKTKSVEQRYSSPKESLRGLVSVSMTNTKTKCFPGSSVVQEVTKGLEAAGNQGQRMQIVRHSTTDAIIRLPHWVRLTEAVRWLIHMTFWHRCLLQSRAMIMLTAICDDFLKWRECFLAVVEIGLTWLDSDSRECYLIGLGYYLYVGILTILKGCYIL